MTKDKRYTTVKNLINGGFIKSFNEIFDTVPKSVVYKDLGMNSVRFKNLITHVDRFVIKDLFRIAALVEIDEKLILDLLYNEYFKTKKHKRKDGSR